VTSPQSEVRRHIVPDSSSSCTQSVYERLKVKARHFYSITNHKLQLQRRFASQTEHMELTLWPSSHTQPKSAA